MVICDDTGPISLAAVMGGADHARCPRATVGRAARGRALGPGDGRAAPPAGTSCSARRPSAGSAASTRSCRWSALDAGRRAARRARRRHGRHAGPRLDSRRCRPRRCTLTPAPAGPAGSASTTRPQRVVELLDAGRLRGRRGDGDRARRSRRRAGGPTCVRPGRPGRGGACGWTATTEIPSVLPIAPPGARPHRGAAPPAHGRPGARRGRATSRCCRTRSWRRRRSTRCGCPPTTRGAARCGWPTRSRRRSRSCAPRCCRRCSATLRRNLGRGAAGPGAVRDRARSSCRTRRRPRRRRWASTARPTDAGVGGRRARLLPHQPWHVAAVLAGDVDPRRLVGPGPRGRLGRRGRGRPDRRSRRPGVRARPVSRAGGRARAVAPGPVRGAAGRRTPWSGTPASCTPRSCADAGAARGVPARWSSTWTRCRPPGVATAPPAVALPARADRRGAGRDAAVPAADGARRRWSRAPASCWSRCGCSTCTSRRAARRGTQVAGVQADVPRPGPDAHRRGGGRGPRRGGRVAAARTGATLRGA